MSLFLNVLQRSRYEYEKFLFYRKCEGILNTPIVRVGKLPFTLLSMVHHRDVLPYIAAMKSFVRYVDPRSVVVVCDPSITPADKIQLLQQVPHMQLRDAVEFTHPSIPRGGCWERLYAITEYAMHDYVIQLDADTLTIAHPAEVERSVVINQGFVLGEKPGQRVLPVAQTAANAAPHVGDSGAHIQHLAEVAMANVGFDDSAKYVRGCAGFTGFQPDADMRAKVVDFSERMRNRFSERWNAWGTEQVASNFTVANQPGTEVLPFPKYGTPNVTSDQDAFVHFIGTKRFVNGKYRRTVARVIGELNS